MFTLYLESASASTPLERVLQGEAVAIGPKRELVFLRDAHVLMSKQN